VFNANNPLINTLLLVYSKSSEMKDLLLASRGN